MRNAVCIQGRVAGEARWPRYALRADNCLQQETVAESGFELDEPDENHTLTGRSEQQRYGPIQAFQMRGTTATASNYGAEHAFEDAFRNGEV